MTTAITIATAIRKNENSINGQLVQKQVTTYRRLKINLKKIQLMTSYRDLTTAN